MSNNRLLGMLDCMKSSLEIIVNEKNITHEQVCAFLEPMIGMLKGIEKEIKNNS